MRAAAAATRITDPYRAGLALGEELSALQPEIIFLFASIHLGVSPELLEGLHDGLGSEAGSGKEPIVVGNSGDGIFTAAGPIDVGASALALNSSGAVRWHCITLPGLSADPGGVTRQALAAANDYLQGRTASLMTLFCDFGADASEIEKVIGSETRVPIVGGLAADDNQMRECVLFANRQLLRDHLVLLVAEGALNFSIHIGNSLTPLGEPGLVEEASGKLVVRIDGQTAQDFIVRQSGKEVLESDRGITSLSIIDRDDAGIKRLRSIVPQFTQMKGSLGLYGGIEAGKRVQVCVARPEELVDEVYRIARAPREREPVAALMVSCAGRKWLLGEALRHEVTALQERYGDLPLTGFPSFGEIGPLRLPEGHYSRNLFHNMTYVLLLIES